MGEKQEEAVGAIKLQLVGIALMACWILHGQSQDSLSRYKKKVLETVEVDMLMSYYEQEGRHAAVTGGLGNEELTDYSPTIVVRVPINEDAILTADVGISAYTSASSSNGNPFNRSGASYANTNSESPRGSAPARPPQGSPWYASTGASAKDVLTTLNLIYRQASDERNAYWGINLGGSTEWDYESLSIGGSYAKLWNEKNTEFTASAQLFIDRWKPVIPTELHEYELFNETFLYNENSYFSGVSILDEQGNSVASYLPSNFSSYSFTHRNSYAVSLGISQIITPKLQGAFFTDLVVQQGLLSNPLQRVYFQDRPNFFVGNYQTLGTYSDPSNRDLFHLADDVERLPSKRVKLPIGGRLNYYINENLVLRSYLRHYQDDWGIRSTTLQIEVPYRFDLSWKMTPIYRYYSQTASSHFAPYDQHLSSAAFYTSDYDLSGFNAQQWGLSLSYRAVLSQISLFDFGLKSAQIRAQNYSRSDGLKAFIVSTAFRFVLD